MNKMKSVYDNGYQMIGTIKNMRNYIQKCIRNVIKQGETPKELEELLEEVKEYSDEDVVMIDYDRPMGFALYIFNKSDLTEV